MSNTKPKKVQFDLLKPHFLTEEKGKSVEKPYDLSGMLRFIASQPLKATKHRLYGDNHLFHKCKYHEESKIWELQILHLREQILPGIADDNTGEYELIELEDNEYPAESTTLIYDEKTSIIYMQRNIHGTRPRLVEGLLEKISPKGTLVYLKPIEKQTAMSRVKKANQIRSVILTVDSEELLDEEKNSSLGKTISTFSAYEGNMVTVSMGFGRRKNRYLNKENTLKLLREAYDTSATEKLEVSIRENSDSYIESIDLLDDKIKYIISMRYSRENPITHERLFESCMKEVNKRKEKNRGSW